MEEKHYMISDAAKMVDVESHVLRYWEEELKIDIPRNEMGHRYYTDGRKIILKGGFPDDIGNHRGRKCSGRAGKGKNCRAEGT